ncbi:PDZ domain-containing protein [Cytobacillus oceanisediminis]
MAEDVRPDDAAPGADPEQDAAHRLGRRYATMLVAGVSLVALTCVAFLLPAPYVTLRPGPAFDTFGEIGGEKMFTFGKGVKTYPVDGSLDFTTVSVTRADSRLTLGDVVSAYVKPDIAVVPRDVVYPDGESDEASRSEGQAQLTSSKDSSLVVALRAAGYTVGEEPAVMDVADDGAAAGVLESDDEITAVDGRATPTSTAVVEAVGRVEPGETVRLDVVRDGKERTVDLATRPDPKDPAIPRIGVSLGTRYDFPIDVSNNVGDEVGGPSAGTMFALAIYDQLTPGSLTGGRTIAGTGTLSPDGTVGPIGGVQQKIAGAAAAGATIFLVPKSNCEEATRGSDHGLRLVSVSSFKEAVADLEALAEDPDAKVASCR